MPKFCRSSIYVITIVKFSNKPIQNLFNSPQQTNKIFKYLSAPFNLQNFYKKILELIQNYDVSHFWDQNSSFVLNKIFLHINHCYYFHLLMALFILQNLKEILQWIQIMTLYRFWAQSGPFTPNKKFFRKPVNEPCFFYSWAYTCQKSKSDINLLVKY